MRSVKRKARNSVVERTGKIPRGSDVHHRHLRNPSFEYLRRVIRQTKALISSGGCHPDWGRKRLEALQKMLEAKKNKLQRQCMGEL